MEGEVESREQELRGRHRHGYGAREEVTRRKNSQRHKGVPCDYWCELFGGTGVSGHPRGKELR